MMKELRTFNLIEVFILFNFRLIEVREKEVLMFENENLVFKIL